MKRDLALASANNVEVTGPRTKRHRDATPATGPGPAESSEDVVMADAEADEKAGDGEGTSGKEQHSLDEIRELGLQVWNTVRTAVNEEGRTLSHDFLRLPSKRQYPDYYQLIKRPVALDEIKSQLDVNAYSSLEAAQADFETCFKNAKKYNMKESQIWKDAKALQKIAHKAFQTLTANEDSQVDIGDPGASGDDGEGGSKKKKKVPSLTRLMKNRLQKLVGKKDAAGRVQSTEFMDLPPRKKWPLYYKAIKRPICLEDIFKKIKRKEYETIPEFVADVELVFSNALQFNEDHTPIWEDAMELRTYFHRIMEDLQESDPNLSPSTSTLPQDINNGKLKIKLPHLQTNQAPPPELSNMKPTTSKPRNIDITPTTPSGPAPPTQTRASDSHLTAPAAEVKLKSPSIAPSAIPAYMSALPSRPSPAAPTPQVAIPNTTTASTLAQIKPRPTLHQQQTTATGLSASASFADSAKYLSPLSYLANPAQTQPPQSGSANTPEPSNTPNPASTTSVDANVQPEPPMDTFETITLVTYPVGRRLVLDVDEGVKIWALRLSNEEEKLIIVDVTFPSEDDEKSEGEDEKGAAEEKEPEKEEVEVEAEPEKPAPNTRGRKGKGRADAKASAKTKANKDKDKDKGKGKEKEKENTESAKGKEKAKSVVREESPGLPVMPSIDEVAVKMNGAAVAAEQLESDEKRHFWQMDVTNGRHILDMTRKGGVTWQVYFDKPPYE